MTWKLRSTILNVAVILILSGTAAAGWDSSNWDTLYTGSAPIRHIERADNGNLIGTRSSGSEVEVWRSANEGASWSRTSTVVGTTNTAISYADPMLFNADIGGQSTLFTAFTENHATLGHSIRLTSSQDDGATWQYAGTIHDWSQDFVGAPFMFQLSDGTLQTYYDSEKLASDNSQQGNQWIGMKTGSYNAGTGLWSWVSGLVASREPSMSSLARDGLSTVVMLEADPTGQGNDRIMLVTEGVSTVNNKDSNVVRAMEAWNGGRNSGDWDFTNNRHMVYESPSIDATGRRHNAYAPFAIRVGGGPVMVAFSTDEHMALSDLPNAPVGQRHSQIKFVKTTTSFEDWSAPLTMWGGIDENYGIGLFERSSNDVIATLDFFGGTQRILVPATGGSSVPEPTSAMILVSCAVLMTRRSKR